MTMLWYFVTWNSKQVVSWDPLIFGVMLFCQGTNFFFLFFETFFFCSLIYLFFDNVIRWSCASIPSKKTKDKKKGDHVDGPCCHNAPICWMMLHSTEAKSKLGRNKCRTLENNCRSTTKWLSLKNWCQLDLIFQWNI